MKKDITQKVLEAPVLNSKLKAYDYMMRQNKAAYIEEGSKYGERAAEANKIPKK